MTSAFARTAAVVAVACALAAPIGCTLLTEVSGLSGGNDASDPDGSFLRESSADDRPDVSPDPDANVVKPLDAGATSPRAIYAVGGRAGLATYTGGSTDVLSAAILPDGGLGAWTSHPSLPRNSSGPAAIVDTMIVTGLDPFEGTVLFGLTRDGGAPEAWATTTPLPHEGTIASDGTSLFVLGGDAAGLREAVDGTRGTGGGGLNAWTSTTPLPRQSTSATSAVAMGSVFLIGGFVTQGGATGDVQASSVLFAKIGPANSLGPWSSGPELPPTYRIFHASAAIGNHVYVIGGVDSNNAPLTDVCVISLGSDGMPSACVPVAPLPDARARSCAIATDRSLYVIGGDRGGAGDVKFATVYVATPDASGNIGYWTATTELPAAKTKLGCIAL
jgi:hypothetical protein